MNKKLYGALVGMMVGLAVSGSAAASSVSYYMNESNKPSLFPSGSDYLQVTISDAIADDKIYFTVTPLSDLTSITGSNVKIDKFMFNGSALAKSNIDITSAGWKIKNNKSDPHKFGPFSNGLVKKKGMSLLPLVFSIDADSDSVDSYAKPYAGGDTFFAARVGGFKIGCNGNGSGGEIEGSRKCGRTTRAYFAGSSLVPPSAVPVPAAAWLFVSGLLSMVGVSRRHKK